MTSLPLLTGRTVAVVVVLSVLFVLLTFLCYWLSSILWSIVFSLYVLSEHISLRKRVGYFVCCVVLDLPLVAIGCSVICGCGTSW